jgi:hypothetical protein
MRLFVLALFALITTMASAKLDSTGLFKIEIEWVDQIDDNFEFASHWECNAGVSLNRHGQLSCDGLCPQRSHAMKDKNGEVFADSLTAFYSIVDTSHQFYTLRSESNAYEFLDANFASATRISNGVTLCYSHPSIATHSALQLAFKENEATAFIDFNSTTDIERMIFLCIGGVIKMDGEAFKSGMIKAEFDLQFFNALDEANPIFWKGVICTEIER